MMEEVFKRIPRDEVFEETGIQFMALNTIFQLESVRLRTPDVLRSASKILLTADLVHYFLTGRAVAEFTLATTSQLWNPRKHGWSERIVRALDLPIEIFPEVVYPGSVIGPLREDLAREAQVKGSPPVLATTCHDTASAIAAVPAEAGSSWAYLSSGTWSLLGVELESPRIGRQALERNFTNEGGIAGTTRLLKNIIGLWLVQQCRKQWALDGQDADSAELTRMAEESGPAKSFIDPADPSFFAPSDMPAAIRDFCTRTDQAVPATRGEVVRTALESLALAYREVLEYATDLSGKKVDVLHIVGGGSQNRLLNQLAADCLGIPVLTGPVEATALGNVLVQAMGAGLISSVSELRAVARRSTEMVEYSPRDRARWDGAYEIYRKLIARRAN
jgi:rhamnulokinase